MTLFQDTKHDIGHVRDNYPFPLPRALGYKHHFPPDIGDGRYSLRLRGPTSSLYRRRA
ncbi:Protein of unknown function [Pyronema omphalodes CBS 100304]|uniref:Uncharacterized protein n=1 Tax=Pyronema omphalodes (strain CBS 100304) TaxID=1076935 RepID=U4KXA0_PYROM|nr:Protein of unknown function [Pyronema omphalodes CBS 100304]